MSPMQFRTIDSPVGLLTLAGKERRLTHLRMVDQTYGPSHSDWERDDNAFPDAVEQLEAYFAGERREFDLDLDLVGTKFQRQVREALLTILTAKPGRTAKSPNRSANREPPVRSAWPTAAIRSGSSFRVIG
jgi:O6-methylguanine-DNA--protein-cysteine methyltransferase